MMTYAIIADWDAQFKVSRYNYVETENEAIALVDKLTGRGLDALPLAKQAPNAYYVLMPTAPAGTAMLQHRARFWKADPVNNTVSFDTALCHAWHTDVTSRVIDAEADKRVDRVFSPNTPSRADRVRTEMPEGTKKDAFIARGVVLRTAAQTLKDSLAAKTPEEILAVNPVDNIHWPE